MYMSLVLKYAGRPLEHSYSQNAVYPNHAADDMGPARRSSYPTSPLDPSLTVDDVNGYYGNDRPPVLRDNAVGNGRPPVGDGAYRPMMNEGAARSRALSDYDGVCVWRCSEQHPCVCFDGLSLLTSERVAAAGGNGLNADAE